MILFYAATENPVVETLERRLAGYKVVRCRTLDTMARRLRKPRHGLEVVLFIVSGQEELRRICEFKELVRDLRLVMVLPRLDDEMVAWGHKLAPRFMTCVDDGCEQVCAVLSRMLGRRSCPAPRETQMVVG